MMVWFWLTDHAVEVEKMRKVLAAPEKDGWRARFVPDGRSAEHAVFQREGGGELEEKEIQRWAGLADCAHFLSRCLTAGGFSIHEISVPKLVEHLKRRVDTKVLAEQVNRERGQGIVDSGIFQKGDMLGYFNIDPHGDYGGRRQYSHSTMFVGKIKPNDAGRITCHTKSRFGGLSAVSLRRTPSEIASLYAGLLVQEISVHDLVIHPGVTNGLTPLGVLKRNDRGRLSPALVRA